MSKRTRAITDREEAAKDADEAIWQETNPPEPALPDTVKARKQAKKNLNAYVFLLPPCRGAPAFLMEAIQRLRGATRPRWARLG
jgi:hypothetical protein